MIAWPAPTSPNRTGQWVEDGARYWVEMDRDRTLIEASVEVRAHDKVPTMRRIKHPVTLARLQAKVRPVARCPHCGSEVAA